jgi:hypothetical protein
MGSGQAVNERDRGVGGREYVRGEVFLVGERERRELHRRNSVVIRKNHKLLIYHILLMSVVSVYKSVNILIVVLPRIFGKYKLFPPMNALFIKT